MRGRILTTSLLFLLLLAGGVAACGDDGDGGGAAAEAYLDALVASMQDSEGFQPTDEQARCVAERTLDAIGVETLEDADITPEDVAESDGPEHLLDLSERQARAIAGSLPACDIAVLDTFANVGDFSDEDLACIAGVMDEDAVLEAMALGMMQGRRDEADAMMQAEGLAWAEACPEAFGG